MDLTSKHIENFVTQHFGQDGYAMTQDDFQVLRHLMREYEYVLSCEEMARSEAEAEHGEGEDHVG